MATLAKRACADTPNDTWLGVPFTDQEAVDMAERCGFEARHRVGASLLL